MVLKQCILSLVYAIVASLCQSASFISRAWLSEQRCCGIKMRWVHDQRVRHSPDRCVSACLDLLIAWSLETCCFGLATSPDIRAAQLNPNMPSARSISRLVLERKSLTLMRFSQVDSPSKHAHWLSSSSIMFCWTLLLICWKCGFHA